MAAPVRTFVWRVPARPCPLPSGAPSEPTTPAPATENTQYPEAIRGLSRSLSNGALVAQSHGQAVCHIEKQTTAVRGVTLNLLCMALCEVVVPSIARCLFLDPHFHKRLYNAPSGSLST